MRCLSSSDSFSLSFISSLLFLSLSKYFSVDVKRDKKLRYIKLPFLYIAVLTIFIAGGYKKVYSYSLYCLPVMVLIKLFSKISFRRVEIIYSERIYNKFVKYSLRFSAIYKFASKIVVNSDELYENFIESKVSNVVLVRNFVSPIRNELYNSAISLQDVGRINDRGCINVAIPARINKEKNQLFIMRELRLNDFEINGVPVVINLYGEIDDYEYYSEIMKDNKSGCVFHYAHESLSTIYELNEIVCLPSIYEGTSNVILEAMMNRKSFLCSDITANKIISVRKENLFSLGDGGFLKALNSFCLFDASQREEISEDNYNKCCAMYGRESYKKNILNLFDGA